MNQTLRLLALGLVGLAAAGCSSPMTNGAPQAAVSPEQVYPVSVEPEVATLVVRVDDGLQTIARGEDARIRAFIERWKSRGQGMLNAAAPTDTPNQAAASAALEDVKGIMASSGIDRNSVQFTSYKPTSGESSAPITLSFVTYAARAADCGTDWTENLAYTPRNLPWPEFGCSTQHNFAAVIADPRDLIEPHTSDPTDSGRRSTVLEKYRDGQATGAQAAKANADSGQVSSVAQ